MVRKKIKLRLLSASLTTLMSLSLIATNTLTVFADPNKNIFNTPEVNTDINKKPGENIPSSLDTPVEGLGENDNNTKTEDDIKRDRSGILFGGTTNKIEGNATGTITIPGVGTGTVNTDIQLDDITFNGQIAKGTEYIYPLIVKNIFSKYNLNLNMPRELLTDSIMEELSLADIVNYQGFDTSKGSTIEQNQNMSAEYKRALTFLSENGIIHPFPEVTNSSANLITTPYDSYVNDNGVMRSEDVTKADFVMTLMKAVNGVEWSRPLSIKYNVPNPGILPSILDTDYRSAFLKNFPNLDTATNNILLDNSKYNEEAIYMNPNVYELYFMSALNNGVLDITEFSDKTQFVYDYIGYQTLKDNKMYPRWLVRSELMKLDYENPQATSINYIPGSKPFGESYNYTNIGNVVNQLTLQQANEPSVVTQYLTYSNTEKDKQDTSKLPAINRLKTKDTSTFDTNTMRELGVTYNKTATNNYFNTSKMTVMDGFNLIYKALKAFDDVKLTSLEADTIASKFGVRFLEAQDEDKKVVNYLIAKGIINPEEYDTYLLDQILTQEDAYILLYRLCSKGARYNTDFTISQRELEMLKEGFIQTEVKLEKVAEDTTSISVGVIQDGGLQEVAGTFPVYVATANGGAISGYLTDQSNNKLSVEYMSATTDNKTKFITFLVPNKYLSKNLRINATIDGKETAITGIRGTGIYTIEDKDNTVTSGALNKYSLSDKDVVPAKVEDIRGYLLGRNNINTGSGDTPQAETITNNIKVFYTNGLNVFTSENEIVGQGKPSDLNNSSSPFFIILGADSSKIKSIKIDEAEIKFTKEEDNQIQSTLYLLETTDIANKELEITLENGNTGKVTNNSLYYTLSITDAKLTAINVAKGYDLNSTVSNKELKEIITDSLVTMKNTYAEIENQTLDYYIYERNSYTTLEKYKKPLSLNIFNMFNLIMPKSVSNINVTPKLNPATQVETKVELGFSKNTKYTFHDIEVLVSGALNKEFESELKKLVPDISVVESTKAGQGNNTLTFTTKQRDAEGLLAILMNKIVVNGNLTTETKTAFVSIKSGAASGMTGVLIPETELAKYGVEVVETANQVQNLLKNTTTGTVAYLNQSLNKAFIGNEVINTGKDTLLYTTTDNTNYFNLEIISSLLMMDVVDSKITNEGLTVPYKTAGFTGDAQEIRVGSALAGFRQEALESMNYSIVGDSIVVGGTKYAPNQREAMAITSGGYTYIDLTSLSDSTSNYMIARNPYEGVSRGIVGYEMDATITPESVSNSTNISSTLDTYINDIKNSPVKTLKSTASVQKAQDNMILNNTIAHAFMQTSGEYLKKSLTEEYLTKPIINILLTPEYKDTNAAYDALIDYLVSYHNNDRLYKFLGNTQTLPISGDIKAWYKARIKPNDSKATVRLNISTTNYKGGVVPADKSRAALVSEGGNWIVSSAGNTLINTANTLNANTGMSELGFRVVDVDDIIYVTNPYLYLGIPVNTIPLEAAEIGTKVMLPSYAAYTVASPTSTLVYKGTTNMLYNDVAVSLLADNLTKATQINKSDTEVERWNKYYTGLRSQMLLDAKGIDATYLSDPWQSTLEGKADKDEVSYDQVLTLPTEQDLFMHQTQNTLKSTVITNTGNSTITGKSVIPYALEYAGGKKSFLSTTDKIGYYNVDTSLTNSKWQEVSLGKKGEEKALKGFSNNTTLLGKPVMRLKYGTMIVHISIANGSGQYTAVPFNAGTRYVKKQYIDSPVSGILNLLYTQLADVRYIGELASGSKISYGGKTFIKTSDASKAKEYATFIDTTPIDLKTADFRNSLTPLALTTAEMLASVTLNGDDGLQVPLLNLTNLSSLVPPTLAELKLAIPYITLKKDEYSTIYVNNYSSNSAELLYGAIEGGSIAPATKDPSKVKSFPRFDLNPNIKVMRVGDGTTEYKFLGYDPKGGASSSSGLKEYAYMFQNKLSEEEPIKIWEDFSGLELANLYMKDRNLHDPMYNENLLAIQSTSSMLRAETVTYKLKTLFYFTIMAYLIILLALLPLIHFKIVRDTLRTRGGKAFLKVITIGRVKDPEEIELREYYPQILLVLTLTMVLYNMSFNLTFLKVIKDIVFTVVTTIYENIKIATQYLYL